MWATFRFMMNWYVSWSGVRTMSIVWRLPESWIGPNFCVARAGGGMRQESTAIVATATAESRIDIPPSVVWPMCCVCRLQLIRRAADFNVAWRATGKRPPPLAPVVTDSFLQEDLLPREDEGPRSGQPSDDVD